MNDVRLVEPADGALTAPLQKHRWPVDGGCDAAPPDRDASGAPPEDRSLPEAVRFAWDDPGAAGQAATYSLSLSRFPDLREALVLRDLPNTHAEVFHLHVATRYFWKVEARHGNRAVRRSAVWSFTTHEATPRWIAVPGITNVRDLGGWPLPNGRRVRQGLIYRSSEMNSHVRITAEGRQVLVDQLGIRTDLDLRGPPEEAHPVLDPARVEWINIPVQPYAAIGDPRFFGAFRRVFEVLADDSKHPILFHCWGGADRAGTVAFLLSALLGKSPENLIRDYELTSLSIWGQRSRWSIEFQSLLQALAPFDGGSGHINTCAENYLLSIGVSPEMIARLRALLIEGEGPW